VVLAGVDGQHDVRVAEPRGGVGLAGEALDVGGILGEPRLEHLDGHQAIHRPLARLEHGADGALPDTLDDLEIAQARQRLLGARAIGVVGWRVRMRHRASHAGAARFLSPRILRPAGRESQGHLAPASTSARNHESVTKS